MKLTIDINPDNKEALALLNYIRSLQYVQITEEESVELTEDQRSAIDKGLKSLEDGPLTHEEVMASTRSRFPHLFDRRA